MNFFIVRTKNAGLGAQTCVLEEEMDCMATSSFARGLSVLEFFSEGRISAHLDDIVETLGMSRATAYRYLATLCDAGLLASAAGGVYVLGPRVIELDRLIRRSDPFLTAGSKVMREMSTSSNMDMLLASYYRNSVMCVDIAWPDTSVPQLFERGKPMPLFRGAMAKIILANLSSYQLRNVALNYGQEIRAAGLGDSWPEFKANILEISRLGYAVTKAEMIPMAGGVSAAIFNGERKVVGSITFVISDKRWHTTDLELLGRLIMDGAAEISALLASDDRHDHLAQVPAPTVKNKRSAHRRTKANP